jgi:integrase
VSAGVISLVMALRSFVESAPRAYRLKVGNADLFRNSTEPRTSPLHRAAHAPARCRLSPDSVQSLLAKYVRVASERCPLLVSKQVSPHVLRHSAAMELLQAGVDCSVIALWLGHESVETTQTYLHTHLALKEAALAKLKPYQRGKQTRFRPSDPPARLP